VLSWCAVSAVALLAVVPAATSAATGSTRQRVISTPGTIPLRTALFDPNFEGPQQATAFPMARAAGASYVRLPVSWRAIAPATPPQGFVAADPTSPGYTWASMDTILGEAEAEGLTPILDINSTPAWAYRTKPNGVNGGSPNVADLADFAAALATHYDGLTAGAPAEHVFQVWNEPNLSTDMSPVSASAYRAMVNAVADGVHAIDPSNVVVAGALDPFGHKKSHKQKWYSVRPLAFMRSLLCVSKGSHPHSTCAAKVHFDVWSHHPYSYGGPFGRAKLVDDVEIGDLPKMHALLKAGVRLHHIVSSHPVQFWVTEFGWDTKPPRPHGASLSLASRWTSESLHQMWLSGVSLVTWFLLEDYPKGSPYDSGLFFHASSLGHARAKPVRTAFRFPFVAYLKKKTVSTWGRVATSDKRVVTVQRRHGKSGAWKSVARISSNRYGIFKATLKLKATKKDWLRAVAAGSGKSLAFSLTPPPGTKIGPFGN
jgi:Cellulase (glycosyl hydrolase family 5)